MSHGEASLGVRDADGDDAPTDPGVTYLLEGRGCGTFVGGDGPFSRGPGCEARVNADVRLQGELLTGVVLAF